MSPIGITSSGSRSPSSKVPIALLLNVALLAGAAFALYRFRQAWLTSKVFFPVTIAGSSVGVVALTALNCAIWRSKRVNPPGVEASQPVLPEPPHDGGNPTGVSTEVVQALQSVAVQSDLFDSLADYLMLEIFRHLPLEVLARTMCVNKRFYALGKDPYFWRPPLDRAWMGPYPTRLDQAGDRVYLNYCRLRCLANKGKLQDIISETVLNGHTDVVCSAAVTPDGTKIISGSCDKTVKVWDSQTGELLVWRKSTDTVHSVAVTPDGSKIILGSEDGTVRVWDSQTRQELACLTGHTDAVLCVAVTPDGAKIISGSRDTTVKVWDSQTRQQFDCATGRIGWISSVAVTPDGTKIIVGSWDTTVRVCDTKTGLQLNGLKGPNCLVYCVAVTPDGAKIISGYGGGTVMVWDSQTGQELACLSGHTGPFYCVAVTPDGAKIISGSWDGTVMVWDSQTGQELACLSGHTSPVCCVAVTPDGAKIISGSRDKTVRIWGYDSEKLERIEPKATSLLNSEVAHV